MRQQRNDRTVSSETDVMMQTCSEMPTCTSSNRGDSRRQQGLSKHKTVCQAQGGLPEQGHNAIRNAVAQDRLDEAPREPESNGNQPPEKTVLRLLLRFICLMMASAAARTGSRLQKR